jgi:hypothetical protein
VANFNPQRAIGTLTIAGQTCTAPAISLINELQISYRGTGREVLRFGAASSGRPAAVLVAADPYFNLSGGQARAQVANDTVGAAPRGRGRLRFATGVRAGGGEDVGDEFVEGTG